MEKSVRSIGRQKSEVSKSVVSDSVELFSAREKGSTNRPFLHPAGDNALNRQSDRRLTPPCRVNTRSLFLFRLPIPLPLPLLVSLDNYSRLREISHAHSFARLFKGRLH